MTNTTNTDRAARIAAARAAFIAFSDVRLSSRDGVRSFGARFEVVKSNRCAGSWFVKDRESGANHIVCTLQEARQKIAQITNHDALMQAFA